MNAKHILCAFGGSSARRQCIKKCFVVFSNGREKEYSKHLNVERLSTFIGKQHLCLWLSSFLCFSHTKGIDACIIYSLVEKRSNFEHMGNESDIPASEVLQYKRRRKHQNGTQLFIYNNDSSPSLMFLCLCLILRVRCIVDS